MPAKQIIFLVVAAALLIVSFTLQYRQWRFKQRVRGRMAEQGQAPRRPSQTTDQRIFYVVIALMVVAIFFLQPRMATALGRTKGNLILWGTLFVVCWVVVLIRMRMQRDAVAIVAAKRANAGDVDGAIAMLQQAVHEQPTAIRAAALGGVLAQAQRYEEAADALARAEELDPRILANSVGRALMMAKAGHAAAALAHIEATRTAWPQDGGLALAAAHLLLELGRHDEAREQLRQGEELLKVFSGEQRVDFVTTGTMLKDLRERLGTVGERAFQVRTAEDASRC
jgi:tetratricopeptide (TPR) repeat protein